MCVYMCVCIYEMHVCMWRVCMHGMCICVYEMHVCCMYLCSVYIHVCTCVFVCMVWYICVIYVCVVYVCVWYAHACVIDFRGQLSEVGGRVSLGVSAVLHTPGSWFVIFRQFSCLHLPSHHGVL